MTLSIWVEIYVICQTSRSKNLRWRLKVRGVRISLKRDQEKLLIWEVGQGWSKGRDISSYPASYPFSWQMCTQQYLSGRKTTKPVITLCTRRRQFPCRLLFIRRERSSSRRYIVWSHGIHHHWGETECVVIVQRGNWQLLRDRLTGGASAQWSLYLWENNENQLLTK